MLASSRADAAVCPVAMVLTLSLFFQACGARTALEGSFDGGTAPGDDDATYGAVGFATGMSRFAVYKRDRDRDLCVVVGFVGPSDNPLPGLSLPPDWAFEYGWAGDAAGCDRVSWPFSRDATSVVDAAGWAEWDELLCDIDLDLSLELESGETERLSATDLSAGWSGCDE